MSNFTTFVTRSWLETFCQMSENHACQAASCALLHCGCHHPSEQTWKSVTGFVMWATAGSAAIMPTAAATFAMLTRLKSTLSFERTRTKLIMPYYVYFPGPAEFAQRHPEAYQLAFGEGPPSGIPNVLGHRTPELLFYISSGVPLRRSAKQLRGTAAADLAAGGLAQVAPGAPQTEMGQLVNALTTLVQSIAKPTETTRNARIQFLRSESQGAVVGERAAAAIEGGAPAGSMLALPAVEVDQCIHICIHIIYVEPFLFLILARLSRSIQRICFKRDSLARSARKPLSLICSLCCVPFLCSVCL